MFGGIFGTGTKTPIKKADIIASAILLVAALTRAAMLAARACARVILFITSTFVAIAPADFFYLRVETTRAFIRVGFFT
jgi:hypothetical protein